MPTFPEILDDFTVRVAPVNRAAGQRLFDDYAVAITSARPGVLNAAVDESRFRYKVKIWWEPYEPLTQAGLSAYGFSCSCGCDSSHPCRHVWAAFLTAESDLDEEDYGIADFVKPAAPVYGWGKTPKKSKPPKNKEPQWKVALRSFGAASRLLPPVPADPYGQPQIWPAGRQVCYIIDRQETLAGKGLVVEIAQREQKKNGEWAKPKSVRVSRAQIASLPDPIDRLILATMAGAESAASSGYSSYYYGSQESARYRLQEPIARTLLPRICRTGRCFFRLQQAGDTELRPLTWGDDDPWRFVVEVTSHPADAEYAIAGFLERGSERKALAEPVLLTAGGLVFWPDRVDPLDDFNAFGWISYLRQKAIPRIPFTAAPELITQLYASGALPALRLPDELRLEPLTLAPVPHLTIAAPKSAIFDNRLEARLSFDYAGTRVDSRDESRTLIQPDQRRVLVRDLDAEAEAAATLYRLGFRLQYSYQSSRQEWTLASTKLAGAAADLARAGWQVQADGKLYRQPGEFKIEVSSGIDWFELHGSVAFGDQVVSLPALLAALRKGETLITLGDGTVGMLPEEWLKKYGLVAGMGTATGDHVRFSRAQAGLLDALLAAQPEVRFDEIFARTRQALRDFEGVTALEPPANFTGTLRPYQKDGLGWMSFLRKFGFGGCLADDMGLGKTVQVLAMLAARAAQLAAENPDQSRRPSLIVVPRSLVFNWMQEAARFAPTLRVLDQTLSTRAKSAEHLAAHDVVLTTYGTLRNDAPYLKDVEFDYAILDEAQAIKNPASEAAKAARLIRAHHRLALSGTPIQNHLGDLWSLFDFLNPGMLGGAAALSAASGATRSIDEATRTLLARALRPFILRRTKEQVATELPAKLEQTLYCDLDKAQRKAYDDLKTYYRETLLDRIKTEGLAKAKIQILEALLRLRQAACHPGLIDKKRVAEPSAKLDTLLSRLEEIVAEGHRALVFSQFTSFLAIVKKALDARKIRYEYLDGKTRDRQAKVDAFQQGGAACPLFLISLKAGGVGLNLTAADYVFLLDPWWNPAVEAQAIDRTHRIGQDTQVFACRLIARDTVEEKVLQLQQSKRDLADAIINAENSVMKSLKREDLELLLS